MDAVIQCFKAEFERFWAMLEKQAEICPEKLWGQKAGGYVFWQQIWHTIACAEMFITEDPAGKLPLMEKYSRDVVMFNQTLEPAPDKTEILAEAGRIKTRVLDYYDGMRTADLEREHPSMTRRLGRPQSKQNAALALIRHCAYHVGCCDAVLREHGLKGVY
ncbi:MAG: DinB family protein [Deltaproteobacteria bacterium]|jgi:hypothetical protein|nr:DinB family protein [Deltaproteobacteria bacterium]